MTIVDFNKYIYKNRIKRVITSICTRDLHSHLRIKPLISFFNEEFKENKTNILEIGCGNGINAFEIYKNNNKIEYVGFDLNLDSINDARKIAKKMGCDGKINFYCEDATKLEFNLEEKFDVILLIDFLEHIKHPEIFLKNINHLITEKTIIIVSVPTYKYKKIFGTEFHEKIGHVKDGYSIYELFDLFEKIDLKNKYYSYNTGYFSNIGCFFYYRYFPKNQYINFIKIVLLNPFRFLDFYNSNNVSCTIFAVFSRGNKNI